MTSDEVDLDGTTPPEDRENPALAGVRHTWTVGDYSAVARHLLPISVDVVDQLPIEPGTSLLDVGVGDGNTAIEAARRGAAVTGIDLTPAQLELAQTRAGQAGVPVELHEANAEALPVPDASFDVVVSVMGMIFAPDHRRATAEMARVTRPGGQVAITSWANDGWFRAWRDRVEGLLPPPPPGAPDPDSWGMVEEMGSRLDAAGLDAQVRTRDFYWTFASLDQALGFFLTQAGPFVALMETVTPMGLADEVTAALRDAMEATNTATDGRVRLDAPYLVGIGRR